MLLVDARGAPLSIIVTGANRHDVTQLATTLDSIVVERPEVRAYHPQNLCADAGFRGLPAHGQMVERDYSPACAPSRRRKGAPQKGIQAPVLDCGGCPFLVQPFPKAPGSL